MAEIGWSRARERRAAPPASESAWDRFAAKYLNWEDLLTLALAGAAAVTVSYGLEASEWSAQMPDLVLVSMFALVTAMFMAGSRMSVFSAWPLAVFIGALVTLWQTLEAVGPGTLEMRINAIYDRFYRWFEIAFSDGVSNDSLPFNTLVVGLTWLGTFLFGWSVFRWHHAWIGLLPGGAALFIGIVFVTDSLAAAIALYVLFGFLLVMRTHLTKQMAEWRATNVQYPTLLSLSFLHLTTWALLTLLVAAWIIPVGPYATPGVVNSLAARFEGIGVDFVRLAGPLHVSKVIPVHSYTGVLPFQGSVDLGERELLLVDVQDPTIAGPIALRGTVYEEYGSGGWTAGEREEVQLSPETNERLNAVFTEAVENEEVEGRLVPLKITLEAKSVVGTVLFSPGQPVSSEPAVNLQAPEGSTITLSSDAINDPYGNDGRGLSDEQIIEHYLPDWFTGTSIQRDRSGAVASVEGFNNEERLLPEVASLNPDERVRRGSSYTITGFVPTVSEDDLRSASLAYPGWVREQYLSLPDTLPGRVIEESVRIAAFEATPYDKAKTIETHLRTNYPIDYNLGVTPAGKDTVDYFLFEAKSGFFDYHASAMTVMLRAVDVPARLAVGFVVEDSDITETGEYMVRDRNAYAWTEVYFPEYGWIAFNPSPDRPADLTPREKLPATIAGDRNGDTVIDINDYPDLPVGADPIFPEDLEGFEGVGSGGALSGGATAGGSGSSGYAPWLLGALGVIGAMILGSAALGWRRSVVGLPYAQATWEKTVRLASLAGHGPEPGQTPMEFAGALQREFRGHRVISEIAGAYSRSRFGRTEPVDKERRTIERGWPHLRRALIGRAVSRLLRRRNPPAV